MGKLPSTLFFQELERRQLISLDDLRCAVNEYCTCGGGGLWGRCPACKVWHLLKDHVMATAEKETPNVPHD